MPSAPRPKPRFPTGTEPNKPWIEWVDRQIQSVLGATHRTLADPIDALTSAIATLTAAVVDAQADADSHASRHVRGGADEINGDVIDVDFSPTNYTRTTVGGVTTSNEELTSHLKGVDDALGSLDTRVDALEAADADFRTTGYMGAADVLGTAASTTYYHQPVGFQESSAPPTTISEVQMLWPRAGTIKNLRYLNMAPQAGTNTFSFTLNVNGSDTALTITGLSPSTATVQSDTTHSVTVAVGDKVVFTQANDAGSLAGTTPSPRWCFDFVE